MLMIALGYSILFQEPIGEIFPHLDDAVRENIESILAEFERWHWRSDSDGIRPTPRSLRQVQIEMDFSGPDAPRVCDAIRFYELTRSADQQTPLKHL